ncbi:MAG: peptidylprolyl isomerase [Pseudomonadales bacterium]|jgi:peptidyl-prolyl cis-trans isomerase A (cyclophilin A)|nr:peptidylprolyl isomerase [Pseudomonadales bacterium]
MSRSTLFALLLALSSTFVALPSQAQTYACAQTNMGEFCMKFLRDEAPNTVNNFLNYVNKGAFDKTFIHLAIPGVGIQGGSYYYEPLLGEEVPKDAPVADEFNVSNTRGTVAMHKPDGELNSATTEWFINLSDNSETLDTANGGYTVFATIVKGMDLVDVIGKLLPVSLVNELGDEFNSVPVRESIDPDVGVTLEELVQVLHVYTTDDVAEEPLDPPAVDNTELYQCTADWIAEIFPTEVCMESNMGNFCMDLMPNVASGTVANFLHYVALGRYDNSFIHRSVKNFVVQGGGVRLSPLFSAIPTDDTIDNEYSTPNTRGTVAMAKAADDPNSASSQWFVNLADNSETLGPSNNEGFSVFARVRDADMAVIDQIGALDILDLSGVNGSFGEAPLRQTSNPNGLSLDDFVTITRAYIPGHELNPCLPAAAPTATGALVKRHITLPVRMGAAGQILEFQLNQRYVLGMPEFEVVAYLVRSLRDIGQEVALYSPDDQMLTIPSVYVADLDTVFYNVSLHLLDAKRLYFQVVDFDTDPPVQP